MRAGGFGCCCGDFGGRLLDHRLQPAGGLAIGERCFLRGDVCCGARQLGAIIAIVELHQQVAGFDFLVVGDRDGSMKPDTFEAIVVTSPPT